MAFSGPRRDPQLNTQPKGEEIGSYDNYLDAQRAVDFLSNKEFTVNQVTIVGTDLRMVERITGRRTYATAALQGAAGGAWLGIFFGLMLWLFTPPGTGFFAVFLPAVLIGAGFGILFGVVSHALTGGRRDFSSISQVQASRFSVLCLSESAEEARRLLATLPTDGQAPPQL